MVFPIFLLNYHKHLLKHLICGSLLFKYTHVAVLTVVEPLLIEPLVTLIIPSIPIFPHSNLETHAKVTSTNTNQNPCLSVIDYSLPVT